MKIYTGFGDRGRTRLLGGASADKHALRVHVIGETDELSSALGICMALFKPWPELASTLACLQQRLFDLGEELAWPKAQQLPENWLIQVADVKAVEHWIDELSEQLPPQRAFLLPSGSSEAAQLHLARSICRRLERGMSELAQQAALSSHSLIWINRLSDFLFVLARYVLQLQGIAEVERQREQTLPQQILTERARKPEIQP